MKFTLQTHNLLYRVSNNLPSAVCWGFLILRVNLIESSQKQSRIYFCFKPSYSSSIFFRPTKTVDCSPVSAFHRESNPALPSAFCSASLSGIPSGEKGIPGGHRGENHKKGLREHCVCGLKRAQTWDFWDSRHGKGVITVTWGKRGEFRTGVGCLGPPYGQRSWVEDLSCYVKNRVWRGKLFLLMGEMTPTNSSRSWA